MRSPTVVHHTIRLGDRATCVTLEDAFWLGLKEIARGRRITLSNLVGEIAAQRKHSNLSSAIRLFVLEFYRSEAVSDANPLPPLASGS
jgi:predicted DNA-binding ribbon-helix-helix protein